MTIQLTTKQTAMKQLVLALFPSFLNLRYRLVVCTLVKYDLITTAPGIESIPQSNEDISLLRIKSVFKF
jgi:hypothetical protein